MGKKPTNQDTGLPGVLLQRLKTVSVIVLGLLFAAIMVSCGKLESLSSEHHHKNENVLRYDVNAPFTSLNPATVESSGSNNIFPLLYSYLFVPDDMGNLEPDLADRWSFDPEKKQWTIYLRNDALFHNKRAVTSKDVKYSYENLLKDIRPDLYSVIDRISLLSDTALCIHLKKEDPLILQKIWYFEIIPHQNGKEIDYYHHPIGSGPFKFKYRENNKTVVLEANDVFYNGRPVIDKIVFNYQADREKTWTRLLAGETDIAQEISPKNYKMLKNYQDRFYFDEYTLRYYTILLYNTHDPLFSDPKVRRALSLAIDREYIVENILNGYGRVANGPMGVDSLFHNPKVKPLPFEPQKAIALLKEAGWSYDKQGRYLYKRGKPFEFTLLVFKEGQIEKKVACYIQLCLNEIGIRLQLKAVAFENLKRSYFRNIEFQAVLTELDGAYRSPEFIKTQWSSDINRKANAGCFAHSEVTQLIQKVIAETDPFKKKEMFYKVDELITSLQPGTFLIQKTAIDAMSRRFTLPAPFSLEYEGIYRLRHASLDRSQSLN
jgi:peptide/nickel transport system substrate-binding protein